MKFFSDSGKIKIRTQNTESSDPVVADIIDLRKMNRGKAGNHAREGSQRREEAPSASGTKDETPKIISHYFEKKTKRKPEMPSPRAQRQFSKKIIYGIGILAAFGAGGILLSTVFASATIVIKPKKEEHALSKISITVDPALSLPDVDSRRIPGELMQLTDEFSMSFNATGEKYVETRAKGTVTISNAFSSSPQTLVQTTRFQDTKTNKIYRLTKTISIPGAKIEDGKIIPSSIDAEVRADGTGDTYNISEASFVIPGFKGTPKYEAFTAVTHGVIGGGFKGTSRVVTKGDLDAANAAFEKEARERLQGKLSQQILPGFTVMPEAETFEIVSKQAPNPDDPAETFTISGTARLSNIAFQEKTLLELLGRVVYANEELFRQKSILSETSNIQYDSVAATSDSKLRLNVSGSLSAASAIQTALLQYALAGKSAEEAKQTLRQRPEVGTFGIKIFPFWKSTLPKEAPDISIEIEGTQ